MEIYNKNVSNAVITVKNTSESILGKHSLFGSYKAHNQARFSGVFEGRRYQSKMGQNGERGELT